MIKCQSIKAPPNPTEHQKHRFSHIANEMSARINTSFVILFVVLLLVSAHWFSHSNPDRKLGLCGEEQENDNTVEMATLGGLRDSNTQNSLEIDTLARFAVDEHNKKENALLELARVVKAQEQVVSGSLHHLTLEVIESGKKKLYEAKVWVKPWMNFKELQEFKHVGDVPSFTSSDLGVKKDEQGSGWRSVPVHDPVVQDAAHHAVKTIQERSNSLFPYELGEIVHAKVEVVEESAKFDMLLKVNRGGKEEKFKVEVHKNNEGGFHLNQMESDST